MMKKMKKMKKKKKKSEKRETGRRRRRVSRRMHCPLAKLSRYALMDFSRLIGKHQALDNYLITRQKKPHIIRLKPL